MRLFLVAGAVFRLLRCRRPGAPLPGQNAIHMTGDDVRRAAMKLARDGAETAMPRPS